MLSVRLAHRFAAFSIDLGFEAPRGVTALFGRSGCGKTTVINAVAGLLRPQSGRIVADDAVLLDTARGIRLPPHRRRAGYVFQEARLFPHLTVRQNLAYGTWFSRGRRVEEPGRIIEMLGIGALLDRRPGALSGGEKSRVALGRALFSAPRMLLMDEPLAALDEQRKAEILPYLERLRDGTDLPILYVSHSAAEVARLATTVVLIEAGRLVAAGPAAEVFGDPSLDMGPREAGAILTARVEAREADGLTRLSCAAGPLWLPDVAAAPGTRLRLRILAQDVMLALARPEGISALNVLPGVVRGVQEVGGPGVVVRIDLGGEALLARVTRRSATALDLAPGRPVHAVLKAVAVAPGNIGAGLRPRDAADG